MLTTFFAVNMLQLFLMCNGCYHKTHIFYSFFFHVNFRVLLVLHKLYKKYRFPLKSRVWKKKIYLLNILWNTHLRDRSTQLNNKNDESINLFSVINRISPLSLHKDRIFSSGDAFVQLKSAIKTFRGPDDFVVIQQIWCTWCVINVWQKKITFFLQRRRDFVSTWIVTTILHVCITHRIRL